MSASNERLKTELAEMRKTIESLTSPNVERFICQQGDLDGLPPLQDNVNRIVRVIINAIQRTSPVHFKEGCKLDSNGVPLGAQPKDTYTVNEVTYEISSH